MGSIPGSDVFQKLKNRCDLSSWVRASNPGSDVLSFRKKMKITKRPTLTASFRKSVTNLSGIVESIRSYHIPTPLTKVLIAAEGQYIDYIATGQ